MLRRSRGLYWGLADVVEVGVESQARGLGKGREEAKGPRSRNPALPASTLQPLPHLRFLTPASPCLWEHSTKNGQAGPSRATAWSGVQDPDFCLPTVGDLGSSMHPSPLG